MKPVCEACYRRLHPLGCGCPYDVHELAKPGEGCSVNTHILTDIEMNNRRYLPEKTLA